MKLPPRCSSTHSPKISAFAPLRPIKQSTKAIYNGQTNALIYSHGFLPFDFLLVFCVVITLFLGLCPAAISILGLRGIEWANLGYEGPRKLCIS